MTAPAEALEHEYFEALRAYVNAGNASHLHHARMLGQRALAAGLSVLEVVTLHRTATDRLLAQVTDDDRRRRDMADELLERLLAAYEKPLRDYRTAIEELAHLKEVLRQRSMALENVNHELESFSYSISHDLRAPLRSIDGFSKALVEDFATQLGPAGTHYLDRIRYAAKSMAQLIDDLLALADLTRAPLQRTDVDVTAIVRSIADRLIHEGGERPVEFRIQEGVRAYADPDLLTVLFESLLGNAWKFTSKVDSARIEFAAHHQNGTTIYLVRDNGAGFDPERAAKIFRAFQRLHSSSEFEGTGIGLATVQRIVHRHEGRVWAEGAVGAGATIFFTLGGERAS